MTVLQNVGCEVDKVIQQHYELKNLLVANSFPQVPIITHKIGIYEVTVQGVL